MEILPSKRWALFCRKKLLSFFLCALYVALSMASWASTPSIGPWPCTCQKRKHKRTEDAAIIVAQSSSLRNLIDF